MKKVILLVLMAVSGLVFVSCKKEGIYSPKNKIDKIYYSANTTNEIYENGRWIVEANAETPKRQPLLSLLMIKRKCLKLLSRIMGFG